jgi:cellulose biosynthesis protein BcsQ
VPGTVRVVIGARKGGAGKTAVAALLARELVKQRARVLVLDLDPQRVGVSFRLGADVNSPLPYTAVDLVLGSRGRAFAPQVIVPGRLDLIAGNQRDLASLEMRLRELHQDRRLTLGPGARRAELDVRLKAVEVGYDFVLVDTPTGFGEITTNALEASDVVISPIDMKCADNVESVTDLLEHMEEVSRKPAIYFVPNKFVGRERQCQAALLRARALCGSQLLEAATLPECAAVPRAMTEHRDIVAGSSETAAVLTQAVWRLGQVVLGHGANGAAVAVGGASA